MTTTANATVPDAELTEPDDVRSRVGQLHRIRKLARQGPGVEATRRQHARGKLTVRERLDLLLDEGTFTEVEPLRRHAASGFGLEHRRPYTDGVVAGWGAVNGRTVFVYGYDFRIFAGSLGEANAAKIHRVMDLALATGAPLISLNDGAGARIQEGIAALAGYGGIFHRNMRASGIVPQISVMLGPCAGGASYSPALTDFVFMVRDTAQMFITGPGVARTPRRPAGTPANQGPAPGRVDPVTARVSPSPPPVALDIAAPLAIVRLQDYAARNRMSGALQTALPDALHTAVQDSRVKVVIIEGMYDVFCAGHTVAALLGANQERRVARGWNFVRAGADCPLPVVAAAQGHAIGTGLLLALYADITVLSERSGYAVNALTYGITPCFGATHILPDKLGAALGAEMLYSGRTYRGRELAARGAGVLVVAHDAVPARARAIGLRIAQAPRRSLELLKTQLTASTRAAAANAHDQEIPDHLSTIADEPVRERIRLMHPEPPQANP